MPCYAIFMRMECNVFKDLKDLNLLNKHEQTFISSLFILLSSCSHPFEVRFPRNGVFVPQSLGISLLYHAPSMYEPSLVILEIVVVVKHNILEKHIMRTISSSTTKLT